MISNNHFYYIEDYAIVTREGTVLNNIYGNYFDGCSLYIEKEYGDINIVSNVFLEPLYASGIHSKYLLKRTNISNNTYRFASDKRARLLGIEGIINGNILTVKKDLFNKYDIGAIDERGTLCITGFIDSKNVKVSYDATSIQTGVYSVYWLFPTNLIPLMTISDLALNSIATINENIIDGNIPNNAIKKCVINEELIDGEINVVVDRINDIKFLENCCWTISNLAEETHFKLGNLPEKLYPVQDMYVNVLVRNANDENDIYGTCIALISSLTGEIIIIKKSGDFNKNSVEYSLKTYYK